MITKADFKKVVESMINLLKQKQTSLQKDFCAHWVKVYNQKKEFNTRYKTIAKLERMTFDQVKELYDAIFFEEVARLNYKAFRPDA